MLKFSLNCYSQLSCPQARYKFQHISKQDFPNLYMFLCLSLYYNKNSILLRDPANNKHTSTNRPKQHKSQHSWYTNFVNCVIKKNGLDKLYVRNILLLQAKLMQISEKVHLCICWKNFLSQFKLICLQRNTLFLYKRSCFLISCSIHTSMSC